MRALLIVPDGDVAAFARAMASGADAVLADVSAAAGWAGGGPALFLRARPFDDAGARNELAAAVAMRPAGVFLARAQGGADVQRLGARLAVEEARQGVDNPLRILAFAAETPEAVLALSNYAGASERLAGLVVTSAPLALALRAAPESGPVQLARHLAVIAARAAGVPVFDFGPTELTRTRAAALAARGDGFDGMAALTPAQVAIIKAAFAP